MTFEIINVGNIPNDQSGDPLRTSFIKINNNFSQISGASSIPSASILGGNGTAFTSVTVGTGLDLTSGTLSATISVPTASLLGGEGGNAFAPIAVGSGLSLVSNTLSATVLTVPNASIVGGDGSSLTSISVGSGLDLTAGVLTANVASPLVVPNASILGGDGTMLSSVNIGSGLDLTGGTLSAVAATPYDSATPLTFGSVLANSVYSASTQGQAYSSAALPTMVAGHNYKLVVRFRAIGSSVNPQITIADGTNGFYWAFVGGAYSGSIIVYAISANSGIPVLNPAYSGLNGVTGNMMAVLSWSVPNSSSEQFSIAAGASGALAVAVCPGIASDLTAGTWYAFFQGGDASPPGALIQSAVLYENPIW